ncbi:unnamed protein product [Diplocarpon coronariae]|nr:hypothetical protein JHW43_004564 [Diplocarpon mali]
MPRSCNATSTAAREPPAALGLSGARREDRRDAASLPKANQRILELEQELGERAARGKASQKTLVSTDTFKSQSSEIEDTATNHRQFHEVVVRGLEKIMEKMKVWAYTPLPRRAETTAMADVAAAVAAVQDSTNDRVNTRFDSYNFTPADLPEEDDEEFMNELAEKTRRYDRVGGAEDGREESHVAEGESVPETEKIKNSKTSHPVLAAFLLLACSDPVDLTLLEPRNSLAPSPFEKGVQNLEPVIIKSPTSLALGNTTVELIDMISCFPSDEPTQIIAETTGSLDGGMVVPFSSNVQVARACVWLFNGLKLVCILVGILRN